MKTSKVFFGLAALLIFPLSLIRPNEKISEAKEGLFIDAYLGSPGELSKAVSCFIGNEHKAIDCLKRSAFLSGIKEYSQGIVTYWNANGDITKGAHTVYVKREPLAFLIYNYERNATGPKKYSIISTEIENAFGKDSQFIYGYVWKRA